MLRTFGALPTEERAKTMTGRDYLWCALNLLLDDEEELSLLCPSCRAEAEREKCPVCGAEKGTVIREENPSFDWAKYEARREGRE